VEAWLIGNYGHSWTNDDDDVKMKRGKYGRRLVSDEQIEPSWANKVSELAIAYSYVNTHSIMLNKRLTAR